METAAPNTGQSDSKEKPLPNWLRRFHAFENIFIAVLLGLMVLLPMTDMGISVLELVLKTVFPDVRLTGISGAYPIIQHLVLVLGVLGAALAARDNRLLSLTAVTTFLKGRWKSGATIFSTSFAVAITAILSVAGWDFMLSQKGGGNILAWGVPVWVVCLSLPVGFGLVAVRMLWNSFDNHRERGITLGIAVALICLARWTPVDPEHLKIPALVALGIATAFGAPIFTALGGAALILFWAQGDHATIMASKHYALSIDAMLPTIPLFTLAGYFLAEGGASKRLIRVFQALVGHLRGGSAILTVLVCAFFTSFTGASGVTILALGGLLMPVLIAAKFSEKSALGLLTGAGSLGLLFPPCIPLILYAIVAGDIQHQLPSQMSDPTPIVQSVGEGDAGAAEDEFGGMSFEEMGELDLDSISFEELGAADDPTPEDKTPVDPDAGSAPKTEGDPPAKTKEEAEEDDFEKMFSEGLDLDTPDESAEAVASDASDDAPGAPAVNSPTKTKKPREVSIEAMFLGGIGPGLLMVLMAAWWGRRQGSVADVAEAHFDSKEAKAALWEAKWELLIPVVALVAIFGGFASIVQASALTAFYAFFVEVFIYRDLKIKKDLPRVMAECGLLVGGVLLIIGVAQGFNNYLITEEAPQRLLAWVQTTVRSPLVFLLMLNVFLLIVGCVMDLYSAIIVIVPMMVPIGLAFGIDPVHLGIVFMANLQLGYLTPPVGMNLFLAAYRFDKPLPEIYRAVIPMLIVLLVSVLLITYIPALTTFLPDLILGSGD